MAKNKSSSSSSSSSINASDATTPTMSSAKTSPDDGMYLYFSAMGKGEEKKSALAELMYADEVKRASTADDLAERKLRLEDQALALEVAKFNARHEKY
jgi:hypothetical protein